jgi:hypothetical protein
LSAHTVSINSIIAHPPSSGAPRADCGILIGRPQRWAVDRRPGRPRHDGLTILIAKCVAATLGKACKVSQCRGEFV